ncbi:MAG: calcium-binding protein [Bacteroidota bacterium]|nr:calcium-binding protein [Bacteroidota bacterium]
MFFFDLPPVPAPAPLIAGVFEDRYRFKKDAIHGSPGDDTIQASPKGSIIFGGEGNDKLTGNVKNDQLFGENGNDELRGGDGKDLLVGGDGSDMLSGNQGRDFLYSEGGNDLLYGGKDNDFLSAGPGNVYMSGNLGKDVFQVRPATPGQTQNITVYVNRHDDKICRENEAWGGAVHWTFRVSEPADGIGYHDESYLTPHLMAVSRNQYGHTIKYLLKHHTAKYDGNYLTGNVEDDAKFLNNYYYSKPFVNTYLDEMMITCDNKFDYNK